MYMQMLILNTAELVEMFRIAPCPKVCNKVFSDKECFECVAWDLVVCFQIGTKSEWNNKLTSLYIHTHTLYHHNRWYHSSLTGREAETLLLAKGQDGSYLVRSSVHNPGSFVLSARVDERVSHVMIRNRDNNFDVGGGPTFPSLTELVEHYKKNPMVETSGTVINLKVPFHATSFLPANINARVVELQKQHQDVYGKAGFWEEFEVSYCYCWY